jgi:hypothetical protein
MEVKMLQRRLAVCTLVLAVASVGSLTAHHSLASHDTATPVRVKGTVSVANIASG